MMTHRRKRMKHAQWRTHIESQTVSGLSVEEYCQAHDLGAASFQHHLGRMRRESSGESGGGGFTELRRVGVGLRVKGPGGAWTLELDPGFDAETLHRFLAVVGA